MCDATAATHYAATGATHCDATAATHCLYDTTMYIHLATPISVCTFMCVLAYRKHRVCVCFYVCTHGFKT